MFHQILVPSLVLIATIAAMYFLVWKGDVEQSMNQFLAWSGSGKKWDHFKIIVWARLRKLRHIRKLANWPFRKSLHRYYCMMPFAIGHVWVSTDGSGKSFHIIGKLQNGDYILQVSDSVLGYSPPKKLRDQIFEHRMYLYELETHEGFRPEIHSVGGYAGIIWRPGA